MSAPVRNIKIDKPVSGRPRSNRPMSVRIRPGRPQGLALSAATVRAKPIRQGATPDLLPVARELAEWRPFENPSKGLRECLANCVAEKLDNPENKPIWSLPASMQETMKIKTANGEIELSRKSVEKHIESLMFSGLKPFVRGLLDAAAVLLPVAFVTGMFEHFFVYDPWTPVIILTVGFMGGMAWAVVNFVPSLLTRLGGDDLRVLKSIGKWRQQLQLYHVQRLIDKRRESALRADDNQKTQIGAKLSETINQMREEIKKRPTAEEILPLQDRALLTTAQGFVPGFSAGRLIPKFLSKVEQGSGLLILHQPLRSIWRIESMFKAELKAIKKSGVSRSDLKTYKKRLKALLLEIQLKTSTALSVTSVRKKVKEYREEKDKVSIFHPINRIRQKLEQKRRAKRELAAAVLEDIKPELDKLGALLEDIQKHSDKENNEETS